MKATMEITLQQNHVGITVKFSDGRTSGSGASLCGCIALYCIKEVVIAAQCTATFSRFIVHPRI